jgi:hypothetical protein
MQIWSLRAARRDLEAFQARVEQSLPVVAGLRQSAQGRAQIADIRSALRTAHDERQAVADLLATVSASVRPGAQFDSLQVLRVEPGLKTTLFGQAYGQSGPAALAAATTVYRHLRAQSKLQAVDFNSSYVPRSGAAPGSTASDYLQFTLSFVAPGARGQ